MAPTNAVRNFEDAMRPQMQAIRGVRDALHDKRNDFSIRHGVQSLGDEVLRLATALEELVESTAKALETLEVHR